LARGRVEAIAAQQQLIRHSAELALAGRREGEAQIGRLGVEAEQILANRALGRSNDHAGRVGVALALGVVDVMEANALRERLDGGALAREEVPVGEVAGVAAFQACADLARGGWPFVGRDARDDNAVFVRIER